MKIVSDGEYVFGDAKVIREGDKLFIQDPYISREYVISRGTGIGVEPSKPVHVPTHITDYLLIKLEKPLYTSEAMLAWVDAPYELDIRLDGVSIGYLTMAKVKYYLYGDVMEGDICRYHQTKIYNEVPEVEDSDRAYIRLLIKDMRKPLEYIYVHLDDIEIWEEDDTIYYSPLLIEGDKDEVVIKVVDRDLHKITLYEVPVLGGEYEEKWRYRI